MSSAIFSSMQEPKINIETSYLIETWVSKCCQHIDIPRGLIVGNSYNEKANESREMMWLILKEQGWTYRQIGLYFYRSHSAIHSGIKYIRGILHTDQESLKIYEAFQLQFQNIFQTKIQIK